MVTTAFNLLKNVRKFLKNSIIRDNYTGIQHGRTFFWSPILCIGEGAPWNRVLYVLLLRLNNNNEQFADLFNAVLFGGEQVISPDELEDADTEESSS